jgi:hypothetical protein
MTKAGDLVEVIPDSKSGLRHGTIMDKADCLRGHYVYYGTILLVIGDVFTTETGNRHIQVLHPEFGPIECNENAVELVSS